VSYGAWGAVLLMASVACLLLAFWRRPANWILILLSIAAFFAGGILLFFGIIQKAVH
jgi:hypothetical protein